MPRHLSHRGVRPAIRFDGRVWSEKAVTVQPDAGKYWNTLGVAYYRAEEWSKSIEALKKRVELSMGQEFARDAFFLAMAHWQLGQKEEARRWYTDAVEWTLKNAPHDEELKRLQAEANALFGPTNVFRMKALREATNGQIPRKN